MLPKKLDPLVTLAGVAVIALAAGSAMTLFRAADVAAEDAVAETPMRPGKADLKSIGALATGPGNVLFAGDSQGAAVYAFEISPPAGKKPAGRFRVEDLDGKIAALLGIGVRDVAIQDMTVHEATGTTYVSVMRGRGDGALPVLLAIAGDGTISEVRLDDVRHQRVTIANPPAKDAKLYRWDSRAFAITDLELIDGELYIAGLSNEEFASVLRRVPYPFTDELAATGLEIYHGAHGAYETFAPIFSFVPYELDGERHLLAGYLCTPLVTFPLDQVRTEPRLRGKTIAELGFGNIPSDLVPYEKDGEPYVLIVNSSRGVMRISGAEIERAYKGPGITRRVGPRTGVEDHTVPVGHVAHAARLDDDRIMILGRDMETGELYLAAAPVERL